jgi:ubiquitin fusion degradation protein 1
MVFNFFRRNRDMLTWKLSPKKYDKGNKHNYGGKVVLPQSVLESLVTHQVQPPYTFEISHTDRIYRTHCGVLEFTGCESVVIVPEWMYQQLNMDLTLQVTIKFKSLSKGTFSKLLPHSVDFLDVESPKTELEKSLRDYQVLTQGDEILCSFEEYGDMRFTVGEILPDEDAIYIVDTDLSVEFLPPIGYEEKVEREKSVLPHLKVHKSKYEHPPIEMKEPGLFFCFEKLKTGEKDQTK